MIVEPQNVVVRALAENYLERYIMNGGAAVKILCGGDDLKDGVAEELAVTSRKSGYIVASVDASRYRVHLVQELFFAIASKIPWLEIAERFSRKLLTSMELDVAADEPLDGSAIAARHALTRAQFNRQRDSALRDAVLRNPNYTRTFKSVILNLVGASFVRDGYEKAVGLRVVEWLRGEPSDPRVLRGANLTRRINRQNGRAMLADLARWTRSAGFPGLVILVDISRYSSPRLSSGNGLRKSYTQSAALDLFEVMRQFIDACDETVGLFLCFLASPYFLSDPRRGVSAYPALKMRVLDDVYDSARPNPLAPLIVLSR